MRCIACNKILSGSEIDEEYCHICQPYIREVFDKDAYILGQSTIPNDETDKGLSWTTLIEEVTESLTEYNKHQKEEEDWLASMYEDK